MSSVAIKVWKLPPALISLFQSERSMEGGKSGRGMRTQHPRPPLLTAKANPESLVTPQGHGKTEERRRRRAVSPAHQKGPSSRDTPKASEMS